MEINITFTEKEMENPRVIEIFRCLAKLEKEFEVEELEKVAGEENYGVYHLGDVLAAYLQLDEVRGLGACRNLLKVFNIERLKDLPVEKYGQFIKSVNTALEFK